MLLVYYIWDGYCTSLDLKLKSLQADNVKKSQIIKLTNKSITHAVQAYQVWHDAKSNNENIPMNGIDIEKCRNILNNLQAMYDITNLSITVSNPVLRNDYSENDNVPVEYSEITIRCSAYIDEDIFQFITKAVELIPGQLQIISINMDAKGINKTVIEDIMRGGSKDIVTAEITLVWQSVKVGV